MEATVIRCPHQPSGVDMMDYGGPLQHFIHLYIRYRVFIKYRFQKLEIRANFYITLTAPAPVWSMKLSYVYHGLYLEGWPSRLGFRPDPGRAGWINVDGWLNSCSQEKLNKEVKDFIDTLYFITHTKEYVDTQYIGKYKPEDICLNCVYYVTLTTDQWHFPSKHLHILFISPTPF